MLMLVRKIFLTPPPLSRRQHFREKFVRLGQNPRKCWSKHDAPPPPQCWWFRDVPAWGTFMISSRPESDKTDITSTRLWWPVYHLLVPLLGSEFIFKIIIAPVTISFLCHPVIALMKAQIFIYRIKTEWEVFRWNSRPRRAAPKSWISMKDRPRGFYVVYLPITPIFYCPREVVGRNKV